VDGQGAYREGRLARADLVDVVQDEKQACLLRGWDFCRWLVCVASRCWDRWGNTESTVYTGMCGI
jgi:hypothetical protein